MRGLRRRCGQGPGRGEGVAQTVYGGAEGLGGVKVVGKGVEEEVEAEEAKRWISDGEADGVDTGGGGAADETGDVYVEGLEGGEDRAEA